MTSLIADGGLVVLAAAVLLLGGRSLRQRRAAVLTAWAATMSSWLVSETIKLYVRSPRPCHIGSRSGACPDADDWSFPSNHATLAGALAACWLILAPPHLRAIPVLLAVAVAASRVAAGVHRPIDVVGGLLLGAGLVSGSIVVTHHVRRQHQIRRR